jgi:hypothetical protein
MQRSTTASRSPRRPLGAYPTHPHGFAAGVIRVRGYGGAAGAENDVLRYQARNGGTMGLQRAQGRDRRPEETREAIGEGGRRPASGVSTLGRESDELTIASVWKATTGQALEYSLLEWPPDALALAHVILLRSEAHRFALSPPGGTSWPPSPAFAGEVSAEAPSRTSSDGSARTVEPGGFEPRRCGPGYGPRRVSVAGADRRGAPTPRSEPPRRCLAPSPRCPCARRPPTTSRPSRSWRA